MKLRSFSEGKWLEGKGKSQPLYHAVSGEQVGEVCSDGVDFRAMLEYGRRVGGPKLRAMTFHERATLLKRLALYLGDKKEDLYRISAFTGATKGDSWIDIDGGIGTLFVFASKGKRELPDEHIYTEGQTEALSKKGSFVGQHICVPLQGVAVHINAFNFPCWGMLEKLAPSILAGVPVIIKPASATAYLAERVAFHVLESGILPEGAFQIICGGVGDLFNHLTVQDVVTFTGSAYTGRKLKQHPKIVEHSVRFNLEADSLNCCILGPDVKEGDPEFELFIKEVVREVTVKAGQKCTAIRRIFAPRDRAESVVQALKKSFLEVKLGDPALDGVRMGPLASRDQVKEVREKVRELERAAQIVCGDPERFEIIGGNRDRGAFFPALLLYCKDPLQHSEPHDIEAFGPVSTVMPYASINEAVELARLGKGSLVGSLFTADDLVAREIILGCGAFHGRMVLINRDCAKESTGHGSPLPHMIHGGPGRAGGGEEMGGVRGVLHYMQRVALQGSPTTLSRICGQWLKGAARQERKIHPFRSYFEELEIGDTLTTHRRTVTEADIVNFAGISGDHFYAHMDDIAAKHSIFEKRVAHGYFVIGAAAGLFVDPAPGPVLANYGVDNLRFIKPVYIGDTIYVKLTCKQKTAKGHKEGQIPQGVVAWDTEVYNQADEIVANYTVLTLVRKREEQGKTH